MVTVTFGVVGQGGKVTVVHMPLAFIQSSVQNVMLFCKKSFMILNINLVNRTKKKKKKTKITASGPITSWQIDGETVEIVSDFIFGGFKITADGDCSHEIKRRFLLRRKVMTSLDSILKSRDITLSTKVRVVKAMVFPVAMYRCKSWTIKKAEH